MAIRLASRFNSPLRWLITSSRRFVLLIAGLALTSGCASRYALDPLREDAPVTLQSEVEIKYIDGRSPSDPFRVQFVAGAHTVVADYGTYSSTWRCTFQVDARPGSLYEIMVRSNPQPIVMFRRERFNALFSNRYDPVFPEKCVKQTLEPYE